MDHEIAMMWGGAAASAAITELVSWVKGRYAQWRYGLEVWATVEKAVGSWPQEMGLFCNEDGLLREAIFGLAEGRCFDLAGLLAKNHLPLKHQKMLIDHLRAFAVVLVNAFQDGRPQKSGEVPHCFDFFALSAQVAQPRDPDLAAPPAPPLPLWSVPYGPAPNPHLRHHEGWVGRMAELLIQGEKAGAYTQSAALTGNGGLGKSAMALAFAQQFRGVYDGGVHWLQMDLGLPLACRQLAERQWLLNLPDDLKEQEVMNLVLGMLRERPGFKLIILDNLEDARLPQEVMTLGQCHLVATSRRQLTGTQAVEMDLPADDEAGLDILLAYAELRRDDLPEAERAAGLELVDRAGRLPMALEILGKLALKRGKSLSRVLAGANDMLRQKGRLETKFGEHPLSIGEVIGLARYQFDPNGRAFEVLKVCGYLAPENIDPELVGIILGAESPDSGEIQEAQEALDELVSFSLIKPQGSGHGYTMHRLLQVAARTNDEQKEIGNQLLNFISNIGKSQYDNGLLSLAYSLIPTIVYLADLSMESVHPMEFPEVRLLTYLGRFLKGCGRFAYSLSIFQSIVDRLERHLMTNDSIFAVALNNLAWAHEAEGNYKEAEELYRRAIVLASKTIGKDHSFYVDALGNLAAVLSAQNDNKGAEVVFREAIANAKSVLPPADMGWSRLYNNLGLAVQSQGRYSEAKELFGLAIEVDLKSIGENHPEHAKHLFNLAANSWFQGKLCDAEYNLRSVIKIDKITIGLMHVDAIYHLHLLADVLTAQNKYREAEYWWRQLLEGIHKVMGDNHLLFALSQSELAKILMANGRWNEVDMLLSQSIKVLIGRLGIPHPQTTSAIQNHLICLAKLGRWPEDQPTELRDQLLADWDEYMRSRPTPQA